MFNVQCFKTKTHQQNSKLFGQRYNFRHFQFPSSCSVNLLKKKTFPSKTKRELYSKTTTRLPLIIINFMFLNGNVTIKKNHVGKKNKLRIILLENMKYNPSTHM